MNLQQRKLNIIDNVVRTHKKTLIEKIEKVISTEKDFWDELSIEEKKGIEKGLKELDAGQRIPYSKVRKKIAKWL